MKLPPHLLPPPPWIEKRRKVCSERGSVEEWMLECQGLYFPLSSPMHFLFCSFALFLLQSNEREDQVVVHHQIRRRTLWHTASASRKSQKPWRYRFSGRPEILLKGLPVLGLWHVGSGGKGSCGADPSIFLHKRSLLRNRIISGNEEVMLA